MGCARVVSLLPRGLFGSLGWFLNRKPKSAVGILPVFDVFFQFKETGNQKKGLLLLSYSALLHCAVSKAGICLNCPPLRPTPLPKHRCSFPCKCLGRG